MPQWSYGSADRQGRAHLALDLPPLCSPGSQTGMTLGDEPHFVESRVEQRIYCTTIQIANLELDVTFVGKVSSADVVPHVQTRFFDIQENTSSGAVYEGMLAASSNFSS